MVSSVSGSSPSSSDYQAQQAHAQPPAKQATPSGQDSVELSGAAKASGDADHDGDSH
jgi:hypothetical protein